VVIQTTSYDVLVGRTILYPLGITLDFWEETAYYQPRWQTRNSRKAFLPITFIRGHARKSNNSMKLARFSRLPHGFDLLEGNAHAMDSPPTRELEMLSAQVGPFIQGSPHDSPPSWETLSKLQAPTKHYIHQA